MLVRSRCVCINTTEPHSYRVAFSIQYGDTRQLAALRVRSLLVFIIACDVDSDRILYISLKIAAAAGFIYGTISGEQPSIHLVQSHF